MSHGSPDDDAAPENEPDAPLPATRWWNSPRLPSFVALAIAVIAAALAFVVWFRPSHEAASSPTFSDKQITTAKTNVCAAYLIVHQGVVANTHLANPVANDPIGTLAVAANARLSLVAGGTYLRDRLTAEPATPADLAKAVNAMANTIEQLGVDYLAGATDVVLDPLRSDLNSEIAQINKLCA